MASMSKLQRLVDPRYLAFYAQRQFRSPATRDRIGGWAVRLKPAPAFAAHAEPALSSSLSSDGMAMLGQVLTADQIAEVLRDLEAKNVVDFYRREAGPFLPTGEGRDPNSHVGNHKIEDVLRAPHLLALANRPEILGLVEKVLGCKPAITSLSAWWSYATPIGPQHAEHYHRDVDDWRFIKLFVYLTEVGPDQGPHVYVLRSAKSPSLRAIRRLTDEEVDTVFPGDVVRTVTGQAGSAFLEDTSGIHKGTPVRAGRRLLFQAVYGLTPLPDAPRAKALSLTAMEARHGVALDAYVNQHILG